MLSGFALEHERHSRLRAFDESLRGRSDSVLGAIQDAEDKDNTVAVDARELKIPPADVYRVYSAEGVLLGGSGDAPLGLRPRARDGFFDQRAGRVRYRVYQRSGLRIIDRAETGGVGRSHAVVIVYAASTRHLEHEIVEAAGVYTSMILLVLCGTGGLVVVLVRQALHPLEELAGAAGQVTAPSLTFQTPASVHRVRELKPLAEALNHVLASLREAFAKERRFVGDAAHELKTAVAVARSTVQVLMLKRRTDEEYASGLRRVVEDIGRIEALVAQMLSSSVAAEEVHGVILPVSLKNTVDAVFDVLGPFAEERQVGLRNLCGDDAKVCLREDRALSLVSNLVLNAVQHSEPGMTVTARGLRSHGGSVALEVADTGSGIAGSALPFVFDRFYREDRSRSRATGGAGLGLAICKSIVEGAGGRIDIRSEAGVGTIVICTFMEN